MIALPVLQATTISLDPIDSVALWTQNPAARLPLELEAMGRNPWLVVMVVLVLWMN